jgi:acyl carrier protein
MYDSKTAIEDIERCSNFDSPRYGRLLNWPDKTGIWHYGIGLSDTYVFDTGAVWRAFEKFDAKFVIGVDNLHQPSEKVISRLKLAVQVFESWRYDFIGWNCEHLARLAATGEARCYAIGPILGVEVLGPGINHDANRIFKELSDQSTETRWEPVQSAQTNQDSIALRVKKVISEQLGVEFENVSLNHSLFLAVQFNCNCNIFSKFFCSGLPSKCNCNLPESDFPMDELDAVELLMGLNDEFELEISDDEAMKIRTVQGLVDFISRKKLA